MPIAIDISPTVERALDHYAAAHALPSRQQAVASILSTFLEQSGHLDRTPERGTRPQDLTTANDD
ncbi:MAG: hypothetical protein ABW179_00250 [Methylobacterium sp.]